MFFKKTMSMTLILSLLVHCGLIVLSNQVIFFEKEYCKQDAIDIILIKLQPQNPSFLQKKVLTPVNKKTIIIKKKHFSTKKKVIRTNKEKITRKLPIKDDFINSDNALYANKIIQVNEEKNINAEVKEKTTINSITKKISSDIFNDIAYIKNKIFLHKIYPKRARRRNMQGRVIIRLMINKNGFVKFKKIIQSSGYDILDSAALLAIQKASPFMSVKQNIDVTFGMNYSLQ